MADRDIAVLAGIVVCSILILGVGRLLFVLHVCGRARHATQPMNACPVATLIVLGSGGHTAEMMKLLQGLPADRFSPLHYVAADTDARTEAMLKARKVFFHVIHPSACMISGLIDCIMSV
jgi:beta-1,4-N-acetylglucosaminyltransferase